MWGIRNSITIHYEIIFFPLELDGYFNLEITSFLFGGERVLLSSQPPFLLFIFLHAILDTQFWRQQRFQRLNFTMRERQNKQTRSRRAETVLNQSTNYRIHRHTHQSLPRLKPPTVLPVSSQALRFKLGKRASNRTLTVYCYNFDTRSRWFTGEKSITERKLSLRNLDFSII